VRRGAVEQMQQRGQRDAGRNACLERDMMQGGREEAYRRWTEMCADEDGGRLLRSKAGVTSVSGPREGRR
jgi:hypothetical protein